MASVNDPAKSQSLSFNAIENTFLSTPWNLAQ